MKMLKQKLFASLAMLLVATTMMGTSTYAWFAISTAPEVTGVTTNINANEAFEIALNDGTDNQDLEDYDLESGADDNFTYGALVAFADGDFDDVSMGPAQINTDVDDLETVTYDENGRPDGYVDVDWTTVGDLNSSGVVVGVDEEENYVAFKLDFFMRSNVEGNALLSVDYGTGSATFEDADGVDLIKVAVGYDGTLTAVTLGATSPGTAFAIGADDVGTDMEVTLYFYLDGPNVTNADMGALIEDVAFDIEFSHSAIDGTDSYTLGGTT